MKFSFVIITAFIAVQLTAQPSTQQQQPPCLKSQNKKAQKFLDEAAALYKSRKYSDALSAAGKAVDADPECAGAYVIQGDAALKKKDFTTMEQSYQKAAELCPEANAEMYYQMGWLYFDLKKYKEAEKSLKRFLEFDFLEEGKAKHADNMLEQSKLIAHPVPFNPKPVAGLTSSDNEYLPYISPDNEWAFFTRRFRMEKKGMLTPTEVEKFMFSKKTATGFDKGTAMPLPFNSRNVGNEGAAAITIDNKHLYFTQNDNGNFDICTSDFVNGEWTEIKKLPPAVNDPKKFDSQPSISSDGKTLYFVSDRDSISGMDIFYSTKNEKGEWTKARKLQGLMNTNGNEKTPFIHSDSRSLYFSSDSLPGLGGLDIYKVSMDSSGRWGKPVNIGYPINTDADEVGFFVSTDGKTGYYASNKLLAGNNGYDIYSFDLYEAARPGKVFFQKGVLKTANEEPGPVSMELKNTVTKQTTKIEVDSVNGNYAFVVNMDHDLILTVKKQDYAFESKYISKNDSASKPVEQNIELKKMEVGQQYKINDILFATNSYIINDTIKVVLDNFADFLRENSKLKVDINGHTDNVGDASSNNVLSQNRAKSVYEYLVQHDINSSRLSYKGFGATRPVASNETEDGRARNRRTVFVVLAK